MGDVLPFRIKPLNPATRSQEFAVCSDTERAAVDAIRAASDQSAILAAARPLFDRCRDRYGFVVMRDGLPMDTATLRHAVIELYCGLSMLDGDMNAPRNYPTFGVYFGGRQLAWFEDGYSGTTALAVPNTTRADDIATFVRPRILWTRARSNQ